MFCLSRIWKNAPFGLVGDEVGGQLEIFYSPKENLTFDFNASLTSRHYDYNNIGTNGLILFQRIDRSAAFLPSIKKELSPYWELFLEAEYYYTKNIKIKAVISPE